MERQPLIVALHFIAWLFITVVSVFLFSGILSYSYSTLAAFVNVGLIVVMYYINVHYTGILIERKRYLLYLLWFFGALMVFSVLRMYFNYTFILPHAVPIYKGHVERLSLFSISTTLLALLMSLFYGLLISRSRKEKEYLSIISEQREAQLQFLKAQMNPHFLFNTLNNIYSLTLLNSPKAPEMILLLSDLLRYAVYDGKEKQVLLSREVKQITNFITLFQIKSETPLRIEFKAPELINNLSIEPMILIPLVENCFKHCDFETSPDAFAKIELGVTNGKAISFTTENTINNNKQKSTNPGGVGLSNIRQRLRIRYPQSHTFEVVADINVFKTILTIRIDE